ncbi:MAG: response regulator [Candidatus Aureabacteria bacterium]|nr:response regulator [Candidatus Auribacterota bacterium]
MNILFIDDDQTLHQTIGGFLKKQGYTVFSAFTAEQAINIFIEKDIDLTITDIVLPDFDGIRILKAIKDVYPNAEVIVITGYCEMKNARSAKHYGAFEYLLKPIDLNELLTTIESTKVYEKKFSRGNKE